MAQEMKAQVDKVMNRLRAQLYNTIEQMGFDKTQCNAYKQAVKDITSDAWRGVTNIVEKHESKEE